MIHEVHNQRSSSYNKKRASRAHNTKCVCHIGCRSEALSGNMVEYYVGGVLHLSITFYEGWGEV